MRTRSERRHNDWKKAIRKQHMAGDWYDNLHQYSKNKIHCSCPVCRSKTRPKQQCGPAENWPERDIRQFENMVQQINEMNKRGEINEAV